MTITINVEAEQERQLAARARRRGIPVEQYIRHLVEEDLMLSGTADDSPDSEPTSADAWFEELRELAASAPQTPYISPESIRRENLYEERA